MIPQKIAKFLYWQAERCKGRIGIQERLNWLNDTQNMSAVEIRAIQLLKLNHLLHHAYETVPYYGEVFKKEGIHPDDINDEKDLKKIPLLTRDILLKHQDRLLSSKADFTSLKTNFSSGSTGVRAIFKQDKNFRLWMRAHQIRTYRWCGNWDLGKKFVLLWGSEIYWSMQNLIDKIVNLLSNRREFNTFKLSSQLVKEFIQAVKYFDPVLISSYSNALYLLALETKSMGLKFSSLRAIQITSEPMPLEMRERMLSIFGCEVFDKYGSRETNIVAHESPHHDGMLIQSENVVIEFINKDNIACQSGENGRIILTTLNNFSMPLIRYETQDIAAPLEGYSEQGFKFQRMTSVAGRQQDLIFTPNGDYIDSYFFSYLFMRYENIHWFQVIQNSYQTLSISIMAPNGLMIEEKKEIIDRINHHTGFNFQINFELISELPASLTGKFRLCVSNLKESQHVTKSII